MSQNTLWEPEAYAQNARFASDLGEPVLGLLNSLPKERILDLGCGDGALSEKVRSSGCTLYALDGSFAQIEAAKKRGLHAFVMDGQQRAFKQTFDAVFTNAALHWMK